MKTKLDTHAAKGSQDLFLALFGELSQVSQGKSTGKSEGYSGSATGIIPEDDPMEVMSEDCPSPSGISTLEREVDTDFCADEDDDEKLELLNSQDVVLYELPQTSDFGYVWSTKKPFWLGTILIFTCGGDVIIKLEDDTEEGLYGYQILNCPWNEPGVYLQRVPASERFFIFKFMKNNAVSLAEDTEKTVGLGFVSRFDALNFFRCLSNPLNVSKVKFTTSLLPPLPVTSGSEHPLSSPENPLLNPETSLLQIPEKTQQSVQPPEVFQCPTCKHEFQSATILQAHVQSSHTLENSLNTSSYQENDEKMNKKQKTGACSRKSRKRSQSEYEYNSPSERIREAYNVEINTPHIRIPRGGMQSYVTNGLGRPGNFPCQICPANFDDARHIQFHWKFVHGQPCEACRICHVPYLIGTRFDDHSQAHLLECPGCGKKFSRKSIYTHSMKEHYMEKNYRCRLCRDCYGRTVGFFSFRRLKDHIEKAHSYSLARCSECPLDKGRTLYTQEELQEHRIFHDNKFLYCHLCDDSFRIVPVWMEHKRLQHRHDPAATLTLVYFDGKEYHCQEF